MQNVRILIPVIGFGKAGGYRVLAEFASQWVNLGCVVDFLVHDALSEPYFPTKAGILRIRRDGSISRGAERQSCCTDRKLPHALEIYTRLFKALCIIGGEYDVILANHSLTTFPVFLARCGSARKIYYVQAYEPDYFGLRPGLKNAILKHLSRLSYHLPLSQIANAAVYVNYREINATAWVPPGIDRTVFHRRVESPRFARDKKWTIGSIGRPELDKGTADVQRAFEIIAKADPLVHLKLAYGTARRNWSHERAEIVCPSNDVELAEFYRSVDVLVAAPTQQFGGYHYPVLEAMSCGTPVISTGHMPATQETAWLVDANSPQAIAASLRSITEMAYADVIEKLDRAEEAAVECSWETLAPRFLRLICEER